jgi:hypothetical protein
MCEMFVAWSTVKQSHHVRCVQQHDVASECCTAGYEDYNSIVYEVDVYLLKTIDPQVC